MSGLILGYIILFFTIINYQKSFINKDTDDVLETVIGGNE